MLTISTRIRKKTTRKLYEQNFLEIKKINDFNIFYG